MNVQAILNWLGSSAAPGWIVAVVATITLVITWLRGRERPSRVIVEQVLETTLLSAPKDPHDVARVRILYAEEPIDMLWMTELRLRNVGKTVIPEPKIYIQVDDETKVLDIQVQEVPPGSEADRVSLSVKDNTFMVAYPYLNPFHEHQQQPAIKVLCDRKPETLTIEGGGRGWSLVFLSTARKGQTNERAGQIAGLSLGATIVVFVVAWFLARSSASGRAPTWIVVLGFVLFAWFMMSQWVAERLLTRLAR